jgi:hypothetical protein
VGRVWIAAVSVAVPASRAATAGRLRGRPCVIIGEEGGAAFALGEVRVVSGQPLEHGCTR